jgi:hypothetical protein
MFGSTAAFTTQENNVILGKDTTSLGLDENTASRSSLQLTF